MEIDLVSKQDLLAFKIELLREIKELLKPEKSDTGDWLKGFEVRKMLKISPGTLQNLRINGTLTYSKIGSTFYYRWEDIQKMLQKNSKTFP